MAAVVPILGRHLVTTVQITGASGHAVQIDAEGSDLQTVTRIAKALWKDTREPPPPLAEDKRGALGFSSERRANATYIDPLPMYPATAATKPAPHLGTSTKAL